MKIINVKNMLKLFMLMTISACMIISQTACGSKSSEPVSRTDDFLLNTSCTLTLYDWGEGDPDQILDDAFDKIKEYEILLSKTCQGSDVYQINHGGGQWIQVSDDTITLLKQSAVIAQATGDKFDVTLGEISDMWGFTGEDPRVPEAEDIKSALEARGNDKIEIDGNRVRLTNDQVQLDLGGIAKGYICDRIGDFLEEEGCASAIINLGGNVEVIGEKAEDTPFRVAVERPFSDRTEMVGTIDSVDMTLVTSGIYERKFEENGKLYHHVLDPATGYPVDTDLEAVTITAKKGNSMICDALSTSCLLLGEKKAKEFISQMQEKYPEASIEASFINNKNQITTTKGMNLELVED